VSLSVPAQPISLRTVREFIRHRSEEAGIPSSDATDLLIAVSEVCNNALLHSGSPRISIHWRSDAGRVEVEVRDEGIYGREARPPHSGREGGWGWPIIQSLVDDVRLARGTAQRPGTVVRITKFTSPPQNVAAS
jgi:anti-sigma regulatory factor (Ser/Thr protein kinase)